jgi:hypothetical protein
MYFHHCTSEIPLPSWFDPLSHLFAVLSIAKLYGITIENSLSDMVEILLLIFSGL